MVNLVYEVTYMYKKIINKIKQFETIIIHRHSKPDGDALGSQFGLKEIIETNFPEKKVYAIGDINQRLKFMGNVDMVDDLEYEDALVVVLDCSEKSLISDDRYLKGKYMIKIDHHIMREKFADMEIVDDTFESCCGLIANIAIKQKMIINTKAAEALFTGMVTDSGRFRYDSTSSRTFTIASKLLESNIDMMNIYNNLYLDDLDMVVLRAKFVLKMKFTEHNVAYIKTTAEEFAQLNTDIFTISRGMVNTMSGIKGIDIWVNFTEDKGNGIICEIRSNKYNINPIAVKYGGGGHAKASGATVKNFEIADNMLKDLDNLCK